MRRSTDGILTTHCGSLPRSPEVLAMLQAAVAGGVVDPVAFDAAVHRGVEEVVANQVAAGVRVVNDGEMSKFSFTSYQFDRLTGFEPRESPMPASERPIHPIAGEAADYPEFFERWAFNAGSRASASGSASAERPMVEMCVGPVSYAGMAALERDIANVKAAAAAAGATDVFMTAVPPMGMGGGFGQNVYYRTAEEYETAVADAMRAEYEAIVDAGVVLQLDCNWGVLSRIGTPTLEEVRRTIAHHIEVLNYATRNIDPQMMRIHLCWGADEAPHHRDLPLSDIIDLMLTARPAGLGVVAANGRHEWEWRLWKDVDVPDGKVIIPGVIDTTTNIIEHPETVAERILRFVNVLGQDNVIAGADCGLDTIAGSAQVVPRIAWAKLAALGEGARLASDRLAGS